MTPQPFLVEIVVSDMARSVAFWRRLGLECPEGAEGQPHVDIELGSLRLALDTEETIRSFDPSWTPPAGGHRMALAFACPSPADVDAIYAELTGAGYRGHLEPWDAFWGQRYATVLGPDEVSVDLCAPLSG